MKRPSMKRKTKPKDPDLDAESAETLIWTCSACGVDNPDSKQSCISCGGARAGDTATPNPPEPVEEQEPKELEEPEPLQASRPDKIAAEESPPEPTIFSFDTSEKNPEPPLPEPEITPFLPTPTPYTPFSPSATTPAIVHARYYMVFVNTPAPSIITSTVPIEFQHSPLD